MRTRNALALLTIVSAAMVACSGGPTANSGTGPLASGASNPATNPDSTPPIVPGAVHVSGTVYAVTVVPGSADSIRNAPFANVPLDLYHNEMVDGVATSVFIRHYTSDANGRYSIPSIPGGYYLLYATPPESSGYLKNFNYLPATKSEVTVDVYLWKRS